MLGLTTPAILLPPPPSDLSAGPMSIDVKFTLLTLPRIQCIEQFNQYTIFRCEGWANPPPPPPHHLPCDMV